MLVTFDGWQFRIPKWDVTILVRDPEVAHAMMVRRRVVDLTTRIGWSRGGIFREHCPAITWGSVPPRRDAAIRRYLLRRVFDVIPARHERAERVVGYPDDEAKEKS